MVFSQFEFIFFLLPFFFLLYAVIQPRFRNAWLCLFSLLFYFIGEGARTGILLLSILINYGLGLWLNQIYQAGTDPKKEKRRARIVLAFGVLFNLSVLVYFKYAGFLSDNFIRLLDSLGMHHALRVLEVALPVGISFYTFHGLSYVIDIYRKKAKASNNPLIVGTYLTMFPKLALGPIVRYNEISNELHERSFDLDLFSRGVRRFLVGMVKKVLIADVLAFSADWVFNQDPASLTFFDSWLGALFYTLQLFFDFSGYSDMAIGMASMMGLHFPENFNYPYLSRSIREFWRRWHITLSNWFRDYVYVSLGGNRKGSARTYLNLFIVFFLTGLWHGASWTFVVWGMWHGIFMVLERLFEKPFERIPGLIRSGYTLFVVVVGWVLFRAGSFPHARSMLKAMSGLRGFHLNHSLEEFLNPVTAAVLCLAIVWSLKWHHQLLGLFKRWRPLVYWCALFLLFLLALLKTSASSYSPFLYSRF